MEHRFWHHKWESGQIGFHNTETHPALETYLDTLALTKGDRVFLPLCGKTVDIAYLLALGHHLIGVELSEIAINDLFDELKLSPNITKAGKLTHYSAKGIDIFVGDFFDLTADILGTIQATYDRAALIALPPELRIKYATHLIKITNNAPQLLICLDYDQTVMNGPPFSVDDAEISNHYASHYDIECLEKSSGTGNLKGKFNASENVWLLKSKNRNKRST